jgi:hypothetical protein
MMMEGRDCWNLRGEAFLEDIEWCRHDGDSAVCLEIGDISCKIGKDDYLYL